MRSIESRDPNVMDVDETVIYQYGAIEITFTRLNLNVSTLGINQMLNGQIVTNLNDRRTLARFLKMVTGPGAGILIGILLPAVQKMRA